MLKKAFFILCLILGVGVGIGYYFWRQIVALPEWYDTSKDIENSNSMDDILVNSNEIYEKVEGQIKQEIKNSKSQQIKGQQREQNGEVNIQLAQQDIDYLLSASLLEKADNRSILKAAKTIHTDIKDNKLEIGAVIDTNKISELSLTGEQRKIFEKITESLPQIKNRDVYIAIEGKPKAERGKLVLDEGSKVKIGNLSFTLLEITQKLGLSPQEIQQYLLLDVGQIEIRDIQLSDQGVKLKVNSDLDRR